VGAEPEIHACALIKMAQGTAIKERHKKKSARLGALEA
jgi:hypothetical protein